ncbi:MAG TPA: amino acid permease [Flavobacteriales bacterium]|nr:amino acid permease [Flavobacteriales bacterium]
MTEPLNKTKANFGTMPVFVTAISTILGAILFLRFGYAVGHTGLIGAFGIIILGHLITIPTALAVAEIATNQKVEGGGAYYIISRSFGLNVGAAIGVALFLSQAISVSFYVIAFAESLMPFIDYLENLYPDTKFNKDLIQKIIGLFSMSILTFFILKKGANVGMKALYFVAAILFISLIFFFLGETQYSFDQIDFVDRIQDGEEFWVVFAIIFPAFTGLAAGLGLSGNLKNPEKSIPRGTILATAVGILVYFAVAIKLRMSADVEILGDPDNQLIMSDISIWGPMIPIGLACAAISSALGSVIIAPRTLQALGNDSVFPFKRLNKWFKKERSRDNEPINGAIITSIIAFFFIFMGDINSVAKIITMFFIVTYGAICLISFLEHFSADPSYRPTFKSRWYFSLLGAILSLFLMFKVDPFYALISITTMSVIYYYISKNNKEKSGLEKLFKGVIFQVTRKLQIYLQKKDEESEIESWRPFVICVTEDSFKSQSSFDLVRWISHKYGFGTFMHYINGQLSKNTFQKSKKTQNKLLNISKKKNSRVYIDTIISPSYTSALAQVIQLSGISGKGNNLILFEYESTQHEELYKVIDNFHLLEATEFDVCILRKSFRSFGNKKSIHIWISPQDFENSNLMILLGYILLGHPEWNKAEIKIFSVYEKGDFNEENKKLVTLINEGRLPISPTNIQLIPNDKNSRIRKIINKKSTDADLTIIGFKGELIKKQKEELFDGYDKLGNIIFVNSSSEKEILNTEN